MIYIPLFVSLFSLIFSFFLFQQIKKTSNDSEKITGIFLAIKREVKFYLIKEYKLVALVGLFLFFLLWLKFTLTAALGFLLGFLVAGLSIYLNIIISTLVNIKVAESAKKELKKALTLSFQGGSINSFLIMGLSLLTISFFYFLSQDLKVLLALGFGSSLISLFFQLGNNIYIKNDRIDAYLINKTKKENTEDHSKDLITKELYANLKSYISTVADFFETYTITIIAAMFAGYLLFDKPQMTILPLLLSAVIILASIISTFFLNPHQSQKILSVFYKKLIMFFFFLIVGFYFVIRPISELNIDISVNKIFISSLISFLLAIVLIKINEYFIFEKQLPGLMSQLLLKIDSSNIMNGLMVGIKSSFWTIFFIAITIVVFYSLAGFYGIIIGAISFVSLTGIFIMLNSYNQTNQDAQLIAKISDFSEEAKTNISILNAANKKIQAISKSYAIGSAGLLVLVIFLSYIQELKNIGEKTEFILQDPKVLTGLLIGGCLPYFFNSCFIGVRKKMTKKIFKHIISKLKEVKKVSLINKQTMLEGNKYLDNIIKITSKKIIALALILILTPILFKFAFGLEFLSGVLVGLLITGLFLAFLINSSAAFLNNIKDEKNTFLQKTKIIKYTINNLYADNSSLIINSMIKILNIITLLIIGIFI